MTQVIAYGPEDPLLVVDHTGGSGNPALWFRQDGVAKAYMWWDQANRLLNLGTPVTNPIVSLQDNGAVGIGTVTPYVKLQVAGGGVATDSFFAFSRIQSVAPPWSVYISAPRDNELGLFTDGRERITIGSTGDVGIGRNVQIAGSVGIGTSFPPAQQLEVLRVEGTSLIPALRVLDRGIFENNNSDPAYDGSTVSIFSMGGRATSLIATAFGTDACAGAFAQNNPTNSPASAALKAIAYGPNATFVASAFGAGGSAAFLEAVPPAVQALRTQGDALLQGNVHITGSLRVDGPIDKPGGGFKIDHPLDPANKCLSHSFVESSDMKNAYDGVMALDERGEAVVELPDWFEALNRDFRYQLTAIGGPAPDLHIAEEVNGNRFRIAGGRAGMKVSWMVTGIRQDAWADANRIQVESAKADEECRISQQGEV